MKKNDDNKPELGSLQQLISVSFPLSSNPLFLVHVEVIKGARAHRKRVFSPWVWGGNRAALEMDYRPTSSTRTYGTSDQ